MENSDSSNYQPSCVLIHGLINKLTIIVGHCELLKDSAEEDSECLQRLAMIGDVARSMAEELNRHQCHLDAMMRARVEENVSLSAQG